MNKLNLLIKFFLKSNESTFRKTLIFPYLCIILSVFVITLTTVITEGLSKEVDSIISNFSYPEELLIIEDIDLIDTENIENYGQERLVGIVKYNEKQIIPTSIITYQKYDLFVSKLSYKYLSFNPDLYTNKNNVLVSKSFAEKYFIQINDTLNLYAISDALLHSMLPNSVDVIVSGFYIDHFADYQLIVPNELVKDIFVNNEYTNLYFKEIKSKDSFQKVHGLNSISSINKDSNIVLKWVDIEMSLYIFISYISLIISGFIVYINNSLYYLEKRDQIQILSYLGISHKKSIYYLIIKNVFISLILTLTGILITLFFVILNYYMNIMLLLIPEPFEIIPLSFNVKYIFLTYISVCVIMCTSSILSFIKYSDNRLR